METNDLKCCGNCQYFNNKFCTIDDEKEEFTLAMYACENHCADDLDFEDRVIYRKKYRSDWR